MEHQQESNEQFQAGMLEQRTSLDAEKSRGVHPPRTVAEEVEQMTSENPDGGHRLRDPQKAAEMQRQEYQDGGGDGALMATSQRANELELETEDLEGTTAGRQHQGSDVQSGPSRNAGS